MQAETPYVFGDDSPKIEPEQDSLGFASFAEQLATTIKALSAPKGYVIGLHGSWGSGKSTALNFTSHYIRHQNALDPDNQIEHISFRPWLITGHQDLVSAFFKILSEHLRPQAHTRNRLLRRGLHLVRDTSSSLVEAAVALSVAFDPTVGVASRFGGNVAKASMASLMDHALREPSLQSSYDTLASHLSNGPNRFLVTIDDIDRLEEPEIRSIMRMVKSIGQLPNVIYLLAYDRNIVWKALDHEIDRLGPAFAEKIVQHEVELPKSRRSSLLKMLDHEIDFVLQNVENSFLWQTIVQDGVHRWIQTPRDVVRLTNAIKFSWPTLQGEVDPQDIVAMEGLRLFDPDVFLWLRDNRDFLFRKGKYALRVEEGANEAFDNLKNEIPEHNRSQVLELVSALFPQAHQPDQHQFAILEPYGDIVKRRGIGCEAGYDTYFGFSPSSDAISLSATNALMSRENFLADNVAILRDAIERSDSEGRPLICALLDEVSTRYARTSSEKPPTQMFQALIQVGEDIISIEDVRSRLQIPARSQFHSVLKCILQAWGIRSGGEQMIGAFQDSKSVFLLADIYGALGHELGMFGSREPREPILDEEVFKELGRILKDKIETLEYLGELSRAPFYYSIARSWAYLVGSEPVKAWLENGIGEDPKFMAKVCIGLVGYSVDYNGKNYSYHGEGLGEYYDLEVLRRGAHMHRDNANLSDDERRRIAAVDDGLKQLGE